MSKHKHGKEQTQEEKRELTRKEERLRHRDRERHKKLYTFVGIALGLALLLVIVGFVYQFLVRPNTMAARVGDVTISASQFDKRAQFEKNNLQNQLVRYQQMEQQFGNQGFFETQISQLQSTLASPFAVANQALDRMIQDILVTKEAAARGITASSEEVDAALREEIANSQGLVTVPQATATAQAGLDATATATAWTPTPEPTVAVSAPVTTSVGVTATTQVTTTTGVTTAVTASAGVTATATTEPTPEPQPTAAILTDTLYNEGLTALQNNLQQVSGLSVEDYRKIIEARLLRDKLSEIIGTENVTATTEQIHARHILLRVREPQPTATPLAPDAPTPTPLPPGSPPPTPTPAPRSDAETLALAQEIQARILAGEDFATLAAEYSDDQSNAQNGGDLGWFGKGAMVAAFEEAAFALPVGEVSDPVKTDFGYHLILVDEKDANRPKDPAQLDQERAQAFQAWLDAKL